MFLLDTARIMSLLTLVLFLVLSLNCTWSPEADTVFASITLHLS